MSAYIQQAKREDWRTPSEVVDLVREVFGGDIGLDPCAADEPSAWFADVNWDRCVGNDRPWSGKVYVNPPFGELRHYILRCAAEAQRGAEVVLLMPARTDTRAWHEHVPSASAVCLWRGRLTFVGAPAPAPFPVAFVYWGPAVARFRETFGARGMVFRP